MDRFIPVLVFAYVVFVYPLQAQPSAPYGVSQSSDENSVIICWFYPTVNETTLAVVDDEPQSFLLWGTSDAGARLAAVFDMPEHLCAVAAIELRLWPIDPFPRLPGDESSPFGLSLYSGLYPDTLTLPIWQCEVAGAAPGPNGWLRFPVRKSISADSLVVEFRWSVGTPTAPLPAVVFSDHFTNTYLGTTSNGLVQWNQVYDATALMRVHLAQADIAEGAAVGASTPDSFSVFVFDAPDQPTESDPVVVTINDSLHVILDRSIVGGRFVSVGAWLGGVLGPKSEIIQIDQATGVEEFVFPDASALLGQNFPNPFNAGTTIYSHLRSDIIIYNLLGREVRRLCARGQSTDGTCQFDWDGRDGSGAQVASGVYFYRQDGHFEVKKLMLLK